MTTTPPPGAPAQAHSEEAVALERHAQAIEWKADPSKLKEWIEVRSLVVLQRLEDIASKNPSPELAEKAAKQYLVMAKQLLDAIHEGKMLDEASKKRGR